MSDAVVETPFGPVQVRVHRLHQGWKAVLVGRHDVPRPPVLRGPVARSAEEAVTQLLRAVERVEPLT